MTNYELLKNRSTKVTFVTNALPLLLAFLLCLVMSSISGENSILHWVVGLSIWTSFFYWLLSKSSKFRQLIHNFGDLEYLHQSARAAMDQHYSQYPIFSTEDSFENLYQLNGKTIDEFEKAMVAGMWYCAREVFVAAFIKNGVVIRVSANVGDLVSCGPGEDVCTWVSLCKQMNCDYVRVYHNHPEFNNNTGSSEADRHFLATLESILDPKGIAIHAFIVYWNQVGEWKLMQFGSERYIATIKYFDAESQQLVALDKPKRHWLPMAVDVVAELIDESNRRR